MRTRTCVDLAYPEEYTAAYNGKKIVFVRSVARPEHKLVLIMDVLEHVDDDTGLLRQYTSSIPHGSQVLITVPAFEFLWSGHDVFLEHRRRYTRLRIEEVVSKAGTRVK